MNERIRELADQAELTIHTSIGNYMSRPEFNKKFAELIVKECYKHCKDQLMDEMIIEAIGLTYNDGVGDCAIGLLQHFGVEE